jgi:hypothetical protein
MMFTTTSVTAHSAAIPVEILTTHQHSLRSLMNASSNETANTTIETVAQIATRVSNVKSLGCRRIAEQKSVRRGYQSASNQVFSSAFGSRMAEEQLVLARAGNAGRRYDRDGLMRQNAPVPPLQRR